MSNQLYAWMKASSPVRSVSGRRPFRSASAASTSDYTSPCALCWERPSCWTSAPRRTWSNRSWKHPHTHTVTEQLARACRGSRAAETYGGGLSGRPSDLSLRWRSALVRVDFTRSCVMFNSGCCWMYSRIVSCKRSTLIKALVQTKRVVITE